MLLEVTVGWEKCVLSKALRRSSDSWPFIDHLHRLHLPCICVAYILGARYALFVVHSPGRKAFLVFFCQLASLICKYSCSFLCPLLCYTSKSSSLKDCSQTYFGNQKSIIQPSSISMLRKDSHFYSTLYLLVGEEAAMLLKYHGSSFPVVSRRYSLTVDFSGPLVLTIFLSCLPWCSLNFRHR